jgi:serine/threonine protein phosphatase PrpC
MMNFKNTNISNNCFLQRFLIKTKPGINTDDTTKINQDSFFTVTNLFGLDNFAIFSTLDGHGIYSYIILIIIIIGSHGHYVSNSVKIYIQNYLTNYNVYYSLYTIMNKNNFDKPLNEDLTEDDIYQILIYNKYELIKNCCYKANHELNKTKLNVDYSGTTVLITFIIKNKIISVNCGDSRAIISYNINDNNNYNINNKIELKDKNSNIKYIELTRDHTPNDKDEKIRIIKIGGEIISLNDNENGNNNLNLTLERVWINGMNYSGLTTTRSIGDFIAKKIGVVCEPGMYI